MSKLSFRNTFNKFGNSSQHLQQHKILLLVDKYNSSLSYNVTDISM